MSWKKLFKPVEMPDSDDPKNQVRYASYVAAGRTFAEWTGIAWLGGRIVHFADTHRKGFLVFAFCFIVFLFLLNIIRIVMITQRSHPASAVERVDQALRDTGRLK